MKPKLETQRRASCRDDVEPGLGASLPPWFAQGLLATAVIAAGLACQANLAGRLRADEPARELSVADQKSPRGSSTLPVQPPAPSPSAGAPASLSRHQIVEKLRHACAWVIASHGHRGEAQGTAWLADGPDRLLVTNHHVIAPSESGLGVLPDLQIRVLFPESRNGRHINERRVVHKEGRRYEVRVVDFDAMRDLAVLQVEDPLRDAEPLPLARESIDEGQPVHSMGNPGGDALWVFNSGIVKAAYQKEVIGGGLRRRRFQCVETTEPVNPGDSGGPVVNDSGELVAVNDSHQLYDENGHPVSLVTYAIDMSEVRAFLDEVRPMLHPKTADDYQRRGLRYLSRRRYDEAISDFDETMRQLSSGADPAGVLMNRGLAYARRGTSQGNSRADLEKAITDLTQALDSKPGDPEILIYRGECFYGTNDFLSAKRDFDDAIKLAGDKRVKSEVLAEAYYYLNLMLPRQDVVGKIEKLTEAIRLDPQNFRYHLLRGARLLDRGEPGRALEDTEKAFVIAQNELDPAKWAQIEPHVVAVFINRAACYAWLNRKSEARQDYMTSVGIILRQLRDRPATIDDAKHLILIGRRLFHLPNSEEDAFKLFAIAEKIAPAIASERTTYREKEVHFVNKSQQNLVLFVKYHTLQGGQWTWLPGGELGSGDWVKAGHFKPGEAGFLISKDRKIHADRIRLYITNDENEMVSDRFWSQDLVLAPEPYLGYVPERYVLPFPFP